MKLDSRIFVAGHRGMTGSATVRTLRARGYSNLLLRTHAELDLQDSAATLRFFKQEQPEYVFVSAARVGGIIDNMTHPADFIYDNLMIQNSVIHAAHCTEVKKLLFTGSSCTYPAHCPQPMKEEYMLDGKPEPTNEAYAIAKIAGQKMCQYYYQQYGDMFISMVPPNLYGENDHFWDDGSHVMPALIRRIHIAKLEGLASVEIWGSGKPRREFLYVGDFADAAIFLMEHYEQGDFINAGSGLDVSIKELAELICSVVGYRGELRFNTEKPDGMLKKRMDTTRIEALGWQAKTPLREGIEITYRWFLENAAKNPNP